MRHCFCLCVCCTLRPFQRSPCERASEQASLFRTFITGLGLLGTENCLVFASQNFIYLFFSEKEKFADAYQKRIFL